MTPPKVSAQTPPSVESPVINVCSSGLTSCAVTIDTGDSSYFYAAAIGGSYNISPVDFTPDTSITNQENFLSVLIGHSTSNTGTFNPNAALYPIIGGIGVASAAYATQTFQNTGQSSLSGTLTIYQDSLVIMMSAASNNVALQSLTSTFTVLSQGSSSCCSTVVIADAQLSANSYPFTITYSPWIDPGQMAVGVVFYIFPLPMVSSPLTALPGTTLTSQESGSSWTYDNPNIGGGFTDLAISAETSGAPISGSITSFGSALSDCNSVFQIQVSQQDLGCFDASFNTGLSVVGDVAQFALDFTPGGLVGGTLGGIACSALNIEVTDVVAGQQQNLGILTPSEIGSGVQVGCQIAFDVAFTALLGTPFALILQPTTSVGVPEFQSSVGLWLLTVVLLPALVVISKKYHD